MSISCLKISYCLLANIHRETSSNISPAVFDHDFVEYLEEVILLKEPLSISRDFDFHVHDRLDKDGAKSEDLLLEFGLQ